MLVLDEIVNALVELDVVKTVRRTVTGLADYHPALRRAYDEAASAPRADTLRALADAADQGVQLLGPVQAMMRTLQRGTDAAANALARARQWTERCARGDSVISFVCELAEPAVTKLQEVAEGGLAAWVRTKRHQIDGDVSVLAQIRTRCRE